MIITVEFKNQPKLYLEIENSPVGCRYYELVQKNYQQTKPIYRDELKYTVEYLRELALQARDAFGWGWHNVEDFSSGIAPQLHKDLEILLAKGFQNIPEEYDILVHELHYGLHLVQHNQTKLARGSWLQIEWYNDQGFDLPDDFVFRNQLDIGDVRLQNPFVGHGPWQMWVEQDFINISQTCKFHNFVKPGITIAHRPIKEFDQFDILVEKFQENDPGFVKEHGVEKIKRYTGHPVIGKVKNIEDLITVASSTELLQLENLGFVNE
jgi:hypothetical protein